MIKLNSLKVKLVLVTLALVLVPLLTITIISYRKIQSFGTTVSSNSYSTLEAESHSRLLAEVQQDEKVVNGLVKTTENSVRYLASIPQVHAYIQAKEGKNDVSVQPICI